MKVRELRSIVWPPLVAFVFLDLFLIAFITPSQKPWVASVGRTLQPAIPWLLSSYALAAILICCVRGKGYVGRILGSAVTLGLVSAALTVQMMGSEGRLHGLLETAGMGAVLGMSLSGACAAGVIAWPIAWVLELGRRRERNDLRIPR